MKALGKVLSIRPSSLEKCLIMSTPVTSLYKTWKKTIEAVEAEFERALLVYAAQKENINLAYLDARAIKEDVKDYLDKIIELS